MLDAALRHAEKSRERYVSELAKLVAVPSCSFPGFPPEELVRSAKGVADLFRRSGLEHVQLLKVAKSHPYVYADWLRAPGKPTVLLYAHHDVQPVGNEKKWKSPPYRATRRGGRLFGRGAADDKAGILVHAASIEAYLKTAGSLPLNVKLLIEGDEEVGSDNQPLFLKRYAGLLKADVLVIADSGNHKTGVPSMTTSLRGLVAVDVTVRSIRQSLHSGIWGGPVPDPVIALSKMIASLSGPKGGIAIKGIYDDVRPLNKVEKESYASLRYTEALYRSQAGMLPGVDIIGGKASPPEKMWRLPSVSVNAIAASSRKDCANIINDGVWCRIGVRTVPDMDEGKALRLLIGHLKKNAPWGVKVEIRKVASGHWWGTDPLGKVFQAAGRALSKGYGRRAVYIGTGGSIPFVGPFSKALGGAPALLIGVEDPYSNAHSENESLDLADLQKAIRSSVHLYDELARL
ncbi:MAG: M20/M25/M40 family metallo-hydrolase [Elusimicrobia bacterium]|nr:M20/M25/M40 family metallo-hydrolase [Elusimicrobiota bacterium]